MGAGSINGKMLKNPSQDEKTKSSVQKWPLVEDTKSKAVQKKSQEVAPRKHGHKVNSKPTNVPLRK
jgi:hypothetical protein